LARRLLKALDMNRELFSTSTSTKHVPHADVLNSELAPAYAFTSKHALAHYAATGCLSSTFYASAELQLETVLALAESVPAEFVARTAVWARSRGFMKDLPALLVAYLTVREPIVAERIFSRVIDDTKMLRNFVQIVRSGAIGRRSLASFPKRLVKRWLAAKTPEQLFRGSIGDRPSLGDVIKMAHPRPDDASRAALYAYLSGRSFDVDALPENARAFELWKRDRRGEPPAVPFQLLTALELDASDWAVIARRASWQETRMNLGAFARHGVFASKKTTEIVARRLRDREEVRRARVLPYQLLVAYLTAGDHVPGSVRDSLSAAMEIALENVPEVPGKVYVCPDIEPETSGQT
jgi:60 kDa SS-A/Ro ribonucleoprotein